MTCSENAELEFYEAIKAIGNCALRVRPTKIELAFSPDFGDHGDVESFCSKAGRMPLRPRHFMRHYGTIMLLPDEWYLYFLGQILFSCISNPASSLAKHFVHPKFERIRSKLTPEEIIACTKVVAVLARSGTTKQIVSDSILAGRALYRARMDRQADDVGGESD